MKERVQAHSDAPALARAGACGLWLGMRYCPGAEEP